MSSRRTLIAVLCSALTFSVAASAGLVTTNKANYTIKAKALKDKVNIDGTGGPITAKEVDGNIVFVTNMDEIKLGMEKRTKHAKDEFRAKTHTTTTLTIPKGALKMPEDGKTAEGTVTGKLMLNGAPGEVKVKYAVKRTGSEYEVKSASFSFDYTQYKVKQICMLMVCVAGKVDIKVSNLKLADK